MTWWRDWRYSESIEREMGKVFDSFHQYFGDWSQCIAPFNFDYEQIDCVLEQLWAIREGLSD